jgi:hypothetical protein
MPMRTRGMLSGPARPVPSRLSCSMAAAQLVDGSAGRWLSWFRAPVAQLVDGAAAQLVDGAAAQLVDGGGRLSAFLMARTWTSTAASAALWVLVNDRSSASDPDRASRRVRAILL